jgi:hypothetical protein
LRTIAASFRVAFQAWRQRINAARYIRHAPYAQNDPTGFPLFAVRAKRTLILSCAAN